MTPQISYGLSAFESFNASEPFGIVSTTSRKLFRLTARPPVMWQRPVLRRSFLQTT